jgi:hypothetical protein
VVRVACWPEQVDERHIALLLSFRSITNKLKKPVWQMFPSTHLPNFIQISSAVSEKQGRDKANTG